MPYITQEKRSQLDNIVDELHRALVNMKLDDESTNTEGNINYAVTRLLMLVYGDKNSTRYSEINSAIGLLECIKQEYYRQVAAPYENQKEFENGPVEIEPSHEIVGKVTVTPEMLEQLG